MSDCTAPHPPSNATLRIFLVEDEGLVAMLIEDMLRDLGHEVVATASNARQALAIARVASFDFALVDVNLNGEPSYPIADLLASRGASFAFATGYGAQGVDRKYAHVPRLTKPFLRTDLERLLSHVRRAIADG